MPGLFVLLEHDRGVFAPACEEALTAARTLGAAINEEVTAIAIGVTGSDLLPLCSAQGVSRVLALNDPLISDYSPELWGQAIAEVHESRQPSLVMAVGTDKGNEVLAQGSARLNLPFVANCVSLERQEAWVATRLQWGGSLLEDVTVEASSIFASFGHHSVTPERVSLDGQPSIETLELSLDPNLARSLVQDRVKMSEGATLSTASVVVSGGRGVGSAEGFAPLEQLAELLSGKVGCSRAVTNNGWRSHSDQVGQTGTRIAPDLYVACGISGAIQHWVGAMAAKNILAINTDPEANMVTKAQYAVIADLHEVIPALIAEVKLRREGQSKS